MRPKTTRHFAQRTSQRGITKALVDFTLKYGKVIGDRVFTNRKIATNCVRELKRTINRWQKLATKFKHFGIATLIKKHLAELKQEHRTAKKVLDKGGVVVICYNNHLITAYNTGSYYAY